MVACYKICKKQNRTKSSFLYQGKLHSTHQRQSRHKLWNRLKTQKNAFLACLRAYVGQPDDHIGWATSMPFASIYPTIPEIFVKKYWELWELKNSFFLSRPLWFFFASLHPHENHGQKLKGRTEELKFRCFQQIPCYA